MPRPRAVEAYPQELFDLLEELAARPEVVIECGRPQDAISLRIEIYNFFRVMRREAGLEAKGLLRRLMLAKRIPGDINDQATFDRKLSEMRVWIEKANDTMVRIKDSKLTVCSRSESRSAKLLRAALTKPVADLGGAADESLSKLLNQTKGEGR